MRICKHCGKEISPYRKAFAKYCKDECRVAHYRNGITPRHRRTKTNWELLSEAFISDMKEANKQ